MGEPASPEMTRESAVALAPGHRRVGRMIEIDHAEPAARLEHRPGIRERCSPVGDHRQRVGEVDAVDRRRRTKRRRIGFDDADVREAGKAFACAREQRRAQVDDVEAADVCDLRAEEVEVAPRAAAEFDDVRTRRQIFRETRDQLQRGRAADARESGRSPAPAPRRTPAGSARACRRAECRAASAGVPRSRRAATQAGASAITNPA